MPRVLIVGFGNPLRSDDGVGQVVARLLARELAADDVRFITAHQLTPEISEAASAVDLVLFIDSSREGKPGSVKCVPVTPAVSSAVDSHHLTPAAILKLAAKLYGHCPASYLLTVTGESFETGDGLSPSVSTAIPVVIEKIRNLLG